MASITGRGRTSRRAGGAGSCHRAGRADDDPRASDGRVGSSVPGHSTSTRPISTSVSPPLRAQAGPCRPRRCWRAARCACVSRWSRGPTGWRWCWWTAPTAGPRSATWPTRRCTPSRTRWSGAVADHAGELDRWRSAGWTAGATIGFSEPSVSAELGLPESPTPITMTMLSDVDVAPIRVELMTLRRPPAGSRRGGGIDPSRSGCGHRRRPACARRRRGLGRRRGVGVGRRSIVRRSPVTDAAGRHVVAGVSRGGVRFVLRAGGPTP